MKQILIIQLFILIILILSFFISNIINNISIIFSFIFFLILISIFGFDRKINVKDKIILKDILIFLMIYFILIYLIGLLIGFEKTIYNFNFSNLLNNIIPSFILIILTELTRNEMIKKSNNNMIIILLSFIIYVIFDIRLNINMYNFNILDETYEFIGVVVLGSISKNILLTILSINTGYLNQIIYRLITELYIFIVPIVPAFSMYIKSVLLISIPCLLCLIVNRNLKNQLVEKPKNRKNLHLFFIIIVFLLFILVLLNSGYLKYQSLVIGSNSMKDYMERGDVIIIEKLNDKEKKTIKKGDILIFKYKDKIISHRVYEIVKREDNIYYRTKGDNNSQVDNNIVTNDKIIGVSKYRIKKLGLLSVWLNQILKGV